MAIGALTGALIAARRRVPRLRLIVLAAAAFGLVEIILGLAPNYWSFALISIPTGLAMLTMITAANAAIQISTAEEMRGRVMALYSMIFMGSTPLGAPLIGWIGQQFGARWSILIGGIFSLLIAIAAGVWAIIHWEIRVRLHWSFHPLEAVGPVERARAAQDAAEATRRASEGG